MVKSVLGVNHSGLRDWLVQRISALVMAFYTLGVFLYFVIETPVNYLKWQSLFTHTTVRIATLLFILCLLGHAWVGMWTIFTDYIKPFVLRLILHVLVFFALIAFFFTGLQILWGV